jgi:hypothetical protein
MTLFATLLLAHLLGDFPLQTNRIFRLKIQGPLGLALHAGIHVLVTAVLIQQFWQYWPILISLGIIHYLIDWIKVKHTSKLQTPGFVLDQISHVTVLIIIALIAPDMVGVLPLWFLIPAIVLASIPAFLTLIYIWATDRCATEQQPNNQLKWASTKLLPLTQITGWAIMVALATVAIFITN